MTKEKKEKFIDFLLTLKNYKNIGGLTIGAVIVSQADDLESVQTWCADDHFSLITVGGDEEETTIRKIIAELKKNNNVALALKTITKVMEKFLRQAAENQVNVSLAGEAGSIIANPLTETGRILILMTEEVYNDFTLTEILSPVCQI